MNNKYQAFFGAKFNPFSPDLPDYALYVTPAMESFCWRVENLVRVGGFAKINGDPGTGKSVTMRVVRNRLSSLRDVTVGILTRPQAKTADFYRELGYLFSVPLTPHNRWNCAKSLRDKWIAHIESSLFRPVLLIDEAQEMPSSVFSELRLLSSSDLDSRSILTVVLAGDSRLDDRLTTADLLPIASRIRCRLHTDYATPKQLYDCLKYLLVQAGNPNLMTQGLMTTLCEHAAGNYRTLANMGNDLLDAAVQQEASQIDEKLFFEVFAMNRSQNPQKEGQRKGKTQRNSAARQ